MGLTDRAKELADAALLKAGELSETAREKAPDFLDRAADLAVKAVDTATSGVDRATGGRFHDKLEDAAAKVEQSLDRPRAGGTAGSASQDAAGGDVTDQDTTVTGTTVGDTGTAGPATGTGADRPYVVGQAGQPITPAASNPDAVDPDTPNPPKTS